METLLTHCASVFSQHGGLFAVFFLGGLTGGFTHCLAMCGPVVASEASGCKTACAGAGCKKSTLVKGSGFSYHLGRATTYGALGFLAALFSKHISTWAFWPWLSAAMLFMAGCLFIASSLPGCKHTLFSARPSLSYVRGLLLGFMPCGLLYAALMMAATLANPLAGMLAMWLFVLGTLPALFIAGMGTAWLSRQWQDSVRTAGRAVMAFNGLSLLVMAARVMR